MWNSTDISVLKCKFSSQNYAWNLLNHRIGLAEITKVHCLAKAKKKGDTNSGIGSLFHL